MKNSSNDTNSRLCEAETNDKTEPPRVRDQTNTTTRHCQTCRFVLQKRKTRTESRTFVSQVLRVSTFDKVPVIMIMQTGKYLFVFIFYVMLYFWMFFVLLSTLFIIYLVVNQRQRLVTLESQVIMIIIWAGESGGREGSPVMFYLHWWRHDYRAVIYLSRSWWRHHVNLVLLCRRGCRLSE